MQSHANVFYRWTDHFQVKDYQQAGIINTTKIYIYIKRAPQYWTHMHRYTRVSPASLFDSNWDAGDPCLCSQARCSKPGLFTTYCTALCSF